MTGMLRCPRFCSAHSAGKIFLYARSPVAPKKTSASEWVSFIVRSVAAGWSFAGRLFVMAAEAEAHRGQDLVLEVRLAARGKARVERGREHGRRHRLVDRGLDRPP